MARTRDERINAEVADAVGWDDRKTLTDVLQNAGFRIPPGVSLDHLYGPLIAVAQYGARRAAENLIGPEV